MAATINHGVRSEVLTADMDEQYDWQPPSEAEMKMIAARRERSDKISHIMGDYLLKGYKMLGVVCDECSTILMETKAGDQFCIACHELDTDTDKDDPVVNAVAAHSQAIEGSRSTLDSEEGRGLSRLSPSIPLQSTTTRAEVHHIDIPPTSYPSLGCVGPTRTQAVDGLCAKIRWASDQLSTETNLPRCMQLCELIRVSANAIRSLKELSS